MLPFVVVVVVSEFPAEQERSPIRASRVCMFVFVAAEQIVGN
jgi:hypothetical protein